MKASTSRVCKNYDAIEGHNSNPFELRKLSNLNAKEYSKIEIAGNIAEDMENLLPSFREDKYTINLNIINGNEFIEEQHKSEELGPLIQKAEKDSSEHCLSR
ncbi:hypothetical protein NPIL_201691 [Nephila pilipes]|uniref:Uncharacterized protein n=1 Tax=Nephila pilipes TaxID=299642 RepID=A0A8X6IB49_NEPPI|nr:hypothetical protein NPIL_201691 [Nephila pilipes]